MSTSCPQPIKGSAGSRIQVILGGIGSEYLFVCDEDTGEYEWQSRGWTYGNLGPPEKLSNQLKNCYKKDRTITQVTFGPNGDWFVEGEKEDGSGAHAWWGGTYASPDIKELHGKGEDIKVSFGDNDRWVIIRGRNNYRVSSSVEKELIERLELIERDNKKVHFVRLIPGGGYFISDTHGDDSLGLDGDLLEELVNGGKDPILDVSVAGDGSWIVIRPNRFSCSQNVDDDLCDELRAFYLRYAEIQQQRALEIRKFKQEQQGEIKKQDSEELHEVIENKQKNNNGEKRKQQKPLEESKDRDVQMMDEIRRTEEEERKRVIFSKAIQVGDKVTVIGFSNEPGDAIVKRVKTSGLIQIQSTENPQASIVTIKDPRRIAILDVTEKDSDEVIMFSMAEDKYKAAVSKPYSEFQNDSGLFDNTKEEGNGQQRSQNGQSSSTTHFNNQIKITARAPLYKRRDAAIPFDEYKCIEKINMNKLRDLLNDLRKNSSRREKCFKKISNSNTPKIAKSISLQKLQRCKDLEMYASALAEFLRYLSVDESTGFVEYLVEYEHKNPSFRGRLFATGPHVQKNENDKYARTTTLQGMQRELRTRLVGEIAHDIDCVNSETRIICSLAAQLGVKELIPTVFDYRFKREKWLECISILHGVPTSDAKILPSIIFNGGTMKTWLRYVDKANIQVKDEVLEKRVKGFVFRLRTEIAALRDELLRHPRFKWTSIEREHIIKKGKKGGAVNATLMSRIVHCCENEVLGIIHRCFYDKGWNVLALIFDGLIAEEGPKPCMDLNSVMKTAEALCLSQGWDVELIEKPMHGLQNEDLNTISEAYETMKNYSV